MDMFTGRHQVSMAARRAAVVLMAVLMTLNTVYVGGFGVQKVYADSDLPFTITETTYGIEGDGIAGSKIEIKDKDAKFISSENDGLGVVGVRKKTSTGAKFYLIGRHGVVKTFRVDGSVDVDLSVRLMYEEEYLQYYKNELYAVTNPETGKKDIYNATSDQYITIGADEIYTHANSHTFGYFAEKGMLSYEVNGKYGLIRNSGTVVCNAEYDYLEIYNNGIVGEKDSSCWIINENGVVSGNYSCVNYTDDGCIFHVTNGSNKSAFLNVETLDRVTEFKEDYSYYRSEKAYKYHNKLYYYCEDTDELITQDGVVDLKAMYTDASYDATYIKGNHGIGNSIVIIQQDEDNDIEKRIWLTPDASTEITTKTFDLYTDDPERYADYYEGLCIYIEDDHYIVKNSAGENVMQGFEIDDVQLYGKYVVGTHETDDGGLYYFYNYDADKLAAKNVYYTSLDKYHISQRDIADRELAVVMSKDAPGKFGVIDMNLSSVRFSGYKFGANGFNDRSDIFITHVNRFPDNNWVCQLSYDKNGNIDDDGNELEYVLNSDFKVIDEDHVIQDVRSGDTMRIVTMPGNMSRRDEYYSGYVDDDLGMHILDFSGTVYLDRTDIEIHGDLDHPVYNDAYPFMAWGSGGSRNYGLVTSSGDEAMPCSYSYVGNARNGLVFWENDEESGIATASGEMVISGEFAELYDEDSYDRFKNRANMYTAIALRDYSDKNVIMYLYDYSGAAEGSGEEPSYDNVHKAFSTIYEDEIRTFKGSEGYYYRDSYFSKDADQYDQSLATMSLCLAFSSFGSEGHYSEYDRNVKKILTECGFTRNDRYRAYQYNEKPKPDSIGCVIGSKEIEGETLIAVVVRGGGYEAEWASNLSIKVKNDNHKGFDSSAETVKKRVISYISDMHISGDIKIWLTGYSRAAAVATMAAAKLNDLSGYSYPSPSGSEYVSVDFDKKSIYAYGFATPAGVIKAKDPHSSKYNNIFSVIDYSDPVPLVAPGMWAYDRYGVTKILPYKEGCDPEAYSSFRKALIDKMYWDYRLDEFANYSIPWDAGITDNLENMGSQIASRSKPDPWNNDSMGTFLRNVVNTLAFTIGSRDEYIDKYEESITYNIGQYKQGEPLVIGQLLVTAAQIVPKYVNMFPDITATLFVNKLLLVDVHANQEYYLYSMQLMDPNYDAGLPLVWGSADYRVFEVNCPVDVHVFDSKGREVAGIVNEKPLELSEENSVIASISNDGQKVVYLPVVGEYDVKIQAREDCTVSCGFKEYTTDSGKCVRAASFRTVKMNEGEKLESSVDAFPKAEAEGGAPEGSSVDYDLTKNDTHVELAGDYRGDEIQNHTFTVTTVCDEKKGQVMGGGKYIEGSYAKLTALSKRGYKFEGFYIGGQRVKSDDPDLPENSIRIQVNSDTEVEARFTEKKVSSISLSASPSVNIAAGKKTKLTAKVLPADAAVRTVTWKSSNTSYATVSSSGVVTTKKAGKGKSVVITATATDGSGVKKTIRINIKKGIVTKVSLKGAKTVKAGKTLKVKATVKASKGANKKLVWKSSNTAYAKVSGGKVKAFKAGKGKTVKITASATDGSGKKAVLKIKIK